MLNRNNERGDKASFFALIAAVIIFSFVVGRGWKTLFSTYGITVSWIAAIVVVFIALSLCWGIGSERYYRPNNKGASIAYFFFLFTISALGTINAMFLLFQGSNVIRSEVNNALLNVVKLGSEGAEKIDTRQYERYSNRLNILMSDLEQEIRSPVNCGQGPKAKQILKEIQEQVPGFQPLNLGAGCQNFTNKNNIDDVIDIYKKKIEDGKKLSAHYLEKKNDIQAKIKLINDVEKMKSTLLNIPKEVSSDSDLAKARSDLESVAQWYSISRQELASLSKDLNSIPSHIDISSITSLGNIGQVIPFILSRLNDINTYVFVLFALILDIAVIVSFKRVISSNQVAPSIREQSSPPLI